MSDERENFWECIDGVAHEESCPTLLEFSYAQQGCVLPQDVEDMFEHCNF
ncbi:MULTISPECIES: chitin binding peritrophin-A domain-containing protein [Pseudoalteromonas]